MIKKWWEIVDFGRNIVNSMWRKTELIMLPVEKKKTCLSGAENKVFGPQFIFLCAQGASCILATLYLIRVGNGQI